MRYRSGRGFVPYDYQCKGDPFTRGLRPMPPVFARGHHADGSRRIRRLRTNEVVRMHVRDMVKAVPENFRHPQAARRACDTLALYFKPRERQVELITLTGNPRPDDGTTVRFRVTRPHFGGWRWWLECPICEGLRAVIYGVTFTDQPGSAVGCQSCLGLTHASRSRHKCPDQDGAVLGWQSHNRARTNSDGARWRARIRMHRRVTRIGR